jgi:DNA repair protein RecN (Recombination protein N)
MLISLAINNVVLINRAFINFATDDPAIKNVNNGNLIILSGETGSGKSILIDSLGLIIGNRCNKNLIGNFSDQAQISAQFDISNNLECQKILSEFDLIDYNYNNEIINNDEAFTINIRRIINKNGSSKIYLNDKSITNNLLTKIGENLIEIHGQNEQRWLFNHNFHLEILDQFAKNQQNLLDLADIVNKLQIIDKKIAEFQASYQQKERDKDYLEHIIQELEVAQIMENEELDLINKKDKINQKEKINNFIVTFNNHLTEANSQLILAQRIANRNINIINKYNDPSLFDYDAIDGKISQQSENIEEIIINNQQILQNLNSNIGNIEDIEERLFIIRSLSRKFGCHSNQLANILAESKDKLASFMISDNDFKEWQKEKSILLLKYHDIAKIISDNRYKFSKILENKVEEELKFLKMPMVKFKVEIAMRNYHRSNDKILAGISIDDNKIMNEEDVNSKILLEKYHQKGYEEVKFKAAINNDNFDEIAKVASGGELSRFMLALKVALIDVKSSPTFIFDEIDTGIGGSTADAVGKRLNQLAKNLQVLVVTHQPQIASKADKHFLISKKAMIPVETTIIELNNIDRQYEIARMLSGENISDEALAAAKHLMQF